MWFVGREAKCPSSRGPMASRFAPGVDIGHRLLGACNAADCTLGQTGLVHLLRDLEQVDKYKSPGEDLTVFAK